MSYIGGGIFTSVNTDMIVGDLNVCCFGCNKQLLLQIVQVHLFRKPLAHRQYMKTYLGIFNSTKCDVNPQPNTQSIGPLVMHVLAVILNATCNFFYIVSIFSWGLYC